MSRPGGTCAQPRGRRGRAVVGSRVQRRAGRSFWCPTLGELVARRHVGVEGQVTGICTKARPAPIFKVGKRNSATRTPLFPSPECVVGLETAEA
jgi:hypothetical protein